MPKGPHSPDAGCWLCDFKSASDHIYDTGFYISPPFSSSWVFCPKEGFGFSCTFCLIYTVTVYFSGPSYTLYLPNVNIRYVFCFCFLFSITLSFSSVSHGNCLNSYHYISIKCFGVFMHFYWLPVVLFALLNECSEMHIMSVSGKIPMC